MKQFPSGRLSILMATTGIVLLTNLFALSKRRPNPNVVAPLPPQVPISGSQFITSQALNSLIADGNGMGRRYHYQFRDRPLQVEVRYLKASDGDVRALLQSQGLITDSAPPSLMQIRQQDPIGAYSVFTVQGKAYLSACINPRGGSTTTHAQFTQNRNQHDLQFARVPHWLLGLEDLRDWRCLWTTVSMPGSQSSPDDYRLLEAFWVPLSDRWRSHFPNL